MAVQTKLFSVLTFQPQEDTLNAIRDDLQAQMNTFLLTIPTHKVLDVNTELRQSSKYGPIAIYTGRITYRA